MPRKSPWDSVLLFEDLVCEAYDRFEKVGKRLRWRVTEMAREIGCSRSTVYAWMKALEIRPNACDADKAAVMRDERDTLAAWKVRALKAEGALGQIRRVLVVDEDSRD